jgi:hypothetical protein
MIGRAFATGCFSVTALPADERAWRALLADELALGLSFRKLYSWIGEHQRNDILQSTARNGLQVLMSRKANFDWQRELILDLHSPKPLGRPGVSTLVSH